MSDRPDVRSILFGMRLVLVAATVVLICYTMSLGLYGHVVPQLFLLVAQGVIGVMFFLTPSP